MFTHRLPASPPLHWLLIHIFWFIEARASHFNQGSFLSHGPLIPSISLPASPFFPPQCTLKGGRERESEEEKKNIISFMTDYVFSTWWVNTGFYKWSVSVLNLPTDPSGWKAISTERTKSQGWTSAIWFLLFIMFVSVTKTPVVTYSQQIPEEGKKWVFKCSWVKEEETFWH